MSSTLFVDFRGDGFWAYQVVSSVFLKYLIDVAREHVTQGVDPWLIDAISHWEFDAVCSDCGLYLNDDWSEANIETLSHLIDVTVVRLRERDSISVQETNDWILGGACISTRGFDPIPIAPVIQLGLGISRLINRKLEPPPPDTWWYFAMDEQIRTIRKRVRDAKA